MADRRQGDDVAALQRRAQRRLSVEERIRQNDALTALWAEAQRRRRG